MPCTAITAKLTANVSSLQLQENGHLLSFADVIKHWQNSEAFREFYTTTLLKHGNNGCFWEHPRLNKSTVDHPYECVIFQTDAFSKRMADFKPFARAVSPGRSISVFPNLSGEALLVVPNQPEGNNFNGRDLISFLQSAPAGLMHEFWQTVAREAAFAVATEAPFQYLSTHGLGVLWLHVRLEKRPKYYHHEPYRQNRG